MTDTIESLRAQLATAQAALAASEARVKELEAAIRQFGKAYTARVAAEGDFDAEEAAVEVLSTCVIALSDVLKAKLPAAALAAHDEAIIRKALEDAFQSLLANFPYGATDSEAPVLLRKAMGMGPYAKSPSTPIDHSERCAYRDPWVGVCDCGYSPNMKEVNP